MSDDKWEVKVIDTQVHILPPDSVDADYDDLWLGVTGNMTRWQKEKIAKRIAGILNIADWDNKSTNTQEGK